MTARVVEVQGRGGPEVLKLVTRPLPEPGRGQVRVGVHACGVAYGDVMRRRGVLAPPWRFVPGYDVAGEVEAVGRGVDTAHIGKRVAAMMPSTGYGGYATHVCLPVASLAVLPDGLSYVDAAASVLNGITAWQILYRTLAIDGNTSLLFHGGAGGVGTIALQLARRSGARVFATASAGKHDLVRSLGATPIDYRATRFEDVLAEACPDGVDAVIDGIGGETLRRSWSVTRPGGTVVSLGLTGELEKGWWSLVAAGRLMAGLWWDRRRSLSVYLVGLRYASVDDLQTVLALTASGEVSPVIGATLPLQEVREAHDLLERRAVVGKIVLTGGEWAS